MVCRMPAKFGAEDLRAHRAQRQFADRGIRTGEDWNPDGMPGG
jgi:hypothetical protein